MHNESSSSLEQSFWEDSESSEDEDYMPQHEYHKPLAFNRNEHEEQQQQQGQDKFHRMNQTVWATIDSLNNDTPSDQVRRAIDFTIDNGINIVDLR
jgi:hypothetical protein